jgi:hypothetical protein
MSNYRSPAKTVEAASGSEPPTWVMKQAKPPSSDPRPDDSLPEETFIFKPIHDRAIWEALVHGHSNGSIFSSWGWGAYKQATGWDVTRLRIEDESGTLVACCSVSAKKKFGLSLLHIQGGPLLYGTEHVEQVARMFRQLGRTMKLGPCDLMVVSPYWFGTKCLVMGLLSGGFLPVVNRSHYTLLIDLKSGLEPIKKQMSRQWKKKLKGASAVLEARFPSDAHARRQALQRFAPMYAKLAQRKGFEIKTDVLALMPVVAEDPRFVVLEVLDGDEVVAIRVAHRAGGLMTDFLAATSEMAQRTNAGYFAAWMLVEHAVALGLERMDCGGIDPFHSPGIFQFKRGLSHDACQSEPVWVWSRSKLVRNAAQIYATWG